MWSRNCECGDEQKNKVDDVVNSLRDFYGVSPMTHLLQWLG